MVIDPTLFNFGKNKKGDKMKIPGWLVAFIGKRIEKKLADGKTAEEWAVSKTKLTAVVAVIIKAVETLGPAFGYPIVIPNSVYEFLAAMGLWSLRDGMKS